MKRLESLDILRGFDLFMLTAFGPVLYAFSATGKYGWLAPVLQQCRHARWEGFYAWDMIMPLFMFMAGVSIPFAFGKYREENRSNGKIYLRILKRVLVLWVLGMVCQGNLLDFDIHTLKLYTNTLQSIAVGYLFASIFFLNTKPRTQIGIAAFLLLAYWALMTFVKIGPYGGGDFTRDGNLCEIIDRKVLGIWRHYATLDEAGNVCFSNGYRYTWILSSLNFVVTTMTGVFSGMVLKSKERTQKNKMLTLLVAGVAMIAAALVWNIQLPIIKTIWTSSMVLFTSGIAFLMLDLFYFLVDYKGWKKGLEWLKYYGTNSILAYMLAEVSFACIFNPVLGGLEKYVGAAWYHFIVETCYVVLCFFVLRYLNKHKIYLRA